MENKKLLIMNALIEVISKKQSDDFLIEEVAEKAGIGKGTIYLYFKNKDELLYDSILYSVSSIFEKTKEIIDREELFCLKLKNLFYSFIELNEKTFLLWENYLSKINKYSGKNSGKKKEWAKIKRNFVDSIVEIIKAGKEEKLIDNSEDEELLAEIIYAQMRGLLIELVFNRQIKKNRSAKDKIIKKSLEVVSYGIISNNLNGCNF